jgi:ribosome modulation factor
LSEWLGGWLKREEAMARKDIDDLEVLAAYAKAEVSRFDLRKENRDMVWPEQLLMQQSGEPEKVVFAAMERAFDRGYLEYGVSLRSGWLTPKGAQYLDDNRRWVKGGPRFVRDAAGALVMVGSPPPNDRS